VYYDRTDLPKKPYPYCVLVAFNGDVPYPVNPEGKEKLPCLYTGSGNSTIGDEYSSDDSGNGTVRENSPQVEPETTAYSVNAVYTQCKKRTCENKKCQDYNKSVSWEEWLFDSGASVHVTLNKNLLLNARPVNRDIRVEDGSWVMATMTGRSTCGSVLYLKDILYSSTFDKNITSASQLMANGNYTITMKRNYREVRYMGTYLMILRKPSANLYYLRGNRLMESSLKYLSLRNTKSRYITVIVKTLYTATTNFLLENRFLVISHEI
jgi:hypothetical protein